MKEQYSIFKVVKQEAQKEPEYEIQRVQGNYCFSSLEEAQDAALLLPKAKYIFFRREVTEWQLCGDFTTIEAETI